MVVPIAITSQPLSSRQRCQWKPSVPTVDVTSRHSAQLQMGGAVEQANVKKHLFKQTAVWNVAHWHFFPPISCRRPISSMTTTAIDNAHSARILVKPKTQIEIQSSRRCRQRESPAGKKIKYNFRWQENNSPHKLTHHYLAASYQTSRHECNFNFLLNLHIADGFHGVWLNHSISKTTEWLNTARHCKIGKNKNKKPVTLGQQTRSSKKWNTVMDCLKQI
jgi:hypothetical protein